MGGAGCQESSISAVVSTVKSCLSWIYAWYNTVFFQQQLASRFISLSCHSLKHSRSQDSELHRTQHWEYISHGTRILDLKVCAQRYRFTGSWKVAHTLEMVLTTLMTERLDHSDTVCVTLPGVLNSNSIREESNGELSSALLKVY